MTQNRALHLTGGEALARMLEVHQVNNMFGIGGFQLLPFYNAIAGGGNHKPRHILVNDERSGAFAADASARVSGRPGLCDGTMGPGATNLTTGLIESYTAGIPIVAVIGDSNRDHSWKNMTQETSQREVLSPVVKEFIQVERGHRIPELVRRAFVTATSGRPGPVVISIPENVAHGQLEYQEQDFFAQQAALAVPAKRIRPDQADLIKAAALIRTSARPVLMVGGGIHLSGAYKELADFVESTGIPVAHTLTGKGAISCGHPLCLGLFGRYDRVANEFIKKADLLIALGFKFGEIATNRYSLIPDGVDVVHIDISPEELGKHQNFKVGLWADCKLALKDLLEELKEDAPRLQRRLKDYRGEIDLCKSQWRDANLARLCSEERPITMARVCYELSQTMPADGILLADGGFAAHWTGLLYDTPTAGRTFIANRGNASIGYGVPGGIGAQLAAGTSPVIAITGDGGFNMSMGELETAVRESVPLTILIVNNAASGYVKALQHSMYNRYQSSSLREMNYANIAKAMGANAIRVEDPNQLSGALREAISEKSLPTVVDMVTTRDPSSMLPATDSRTKAK